MRKLITFLLIVFVGIQSAAQGDRGAKPVDKPPVKTKDRLALVIGNSSYSTVSPLTNPSNDADSMAHYLRKMGFDVLLHKDLGLKKTKEVQIKGNSKQKMQTSLQSMKVFQLL